MMFKNCGVHFAATVDILQPTIVIVQGTLVKRWVTPILTPEREHGDHLYEARFGEQRMMVCTFSHPPSHGDLRWGDNPGSAYMREVVVQTFTRRSNAHERARSGQPTSAHAPRVLRYPEPRTHSPDFGW